MPLVNACILIAHTKKLQGLQADANRLPEDAEGFLVRKLNAGSAGAGVMPATPLPLRFRLDAAASILDRGLPLFVPTLLAASLILFVAINVVPGSAARSALGIDATPQAITRFEASARPRPTAFTSNMSNGWARR